MNRATIAAMKTPRLRNPPPQLAALMAAGWRPPLALVVLVEELDRAGHRVAVWNDDPYDGPTIPVLAVAFGATGAAPWRDTLRAQGWVIDGTAGPGELWVYGAAFVDLDRPVPVSEPNLDFAIDLVGPRLREVDDRLFLSRDKAEARRLLRLVELQLGRPASARMRRAIRFTHATPNPAHAKYGLGPARLPVAAALLGPSYAHGNAPIPHSGATIEIERYEGAFGEPGNVRWGRAP